jgi:hypothetical protein
MTGLRIEEAPQPVINRPKIIDSKNRIWEWDSTGSVYFGGDHWTWSNESGLKITIPWSAVYELCGPLHPID